MKRLVFLLLLISSFAHGQRLVNSKATAGSSATFQTLLETDVPSNFLRSNATNTMAGNTVFNLNGYNFTFIATDNDILFKNGANQTIFGVSGAQAYTITQSPGDNSTKVATTAYVDAGLALKANIASPTFTGTPAAPTASPGTNTTQLATTAFVNAAVTAGAVADGDKGDVTVSGSGSVWTVDANINKTWTGLHQFNTSSPSASQNTTSERFGLNATNGSFTYSTVFGQEAQSRMIGSVVIGYKAQGYTNDYSPANNNPYLDDITPPYNFGGAATIVGGGARGAGTAFGYGAYAKTREGIAIGPKSYSPCLACIAIGDGARAMPALDSLASGNEIAIGDAVDVKGNLSVFIGGGYGMDHDRTLCFGCFGTATGYSSSFSTGAGQGFFGAYESGAAAFSSGHINEWYFGPIAASNTQQVSINFTDITGTNQAGRRIVFNGSGGTGTGIPGSITFAPTVTTSSGSGAQTNNDRLEVNYLGTGVYPTNNANNMPFMTTAWGQSSSAVNAVHGINVGISGGSFFRQNTSQAGFGLGYSNVSESNVYGLAISSGGTVTSPFSFDTSNGNIKTASGGQFVFVSTTNARTGTPDAGLSRSAAGVIKFTDGSSATGSAIMAGLTTGYVAKTALYTLTSADYTVEVTSGTHTQTLPTAVGITGKIFVITNSGSGTVTVGTTSSQTFVNVSATPTTLTLNQFQTVMVQSNGANWLRISTL